VRIRPAGTTLTAGELREALAGCRDTDTVCLDTDDFEITAVDVTPGSIEIETDCDDDDDDDDDERADLWDLVSRIALGAVKGAAIKREAVHLCEAYRREGAPT
jgi:hypothetical protein